MATGNSLSDAIQIIIDNIDTAAYTAGVLASQQMKKDFEEMAKGLVDKYYQYQNGQYTRYGRQHNLYNIYTVTTNVKKGKNSIDIELNLDLDPNKLEGLYHSNASEKWANVGADYVFRNFMEGTHPWTNAWPLSGASALEYKEIKASPKVNPAINKYKKSYGDKYFNSYVDKIFMQLIKVYL